MKNLNIKKIIFSALVLLVSSNTLANPETDFKLGVKSFKSGDNAAAAAYFESAMKQGMDSVALHYNLASSYYKLGKYELAKKYFLIVNKTVAMRDLAEYNLGLIALKQKKGNTARKYFNSVVSSGKDKKLTRLSKKQLATLKKTEYRLKPYVSFMLGFDDNVTAVPDTYELNDSDTFYKLYASVYSIIAGKTKDGWVVNGYYSGKDYSDVDSDVEVFGLGIKREKQLKGWDTSIRFGLTKDYYADEDYLTSANLFLKGKKRLARNKNLYLSYRIEQFNSDDSSFDYLEGWRQQVRAEYRSYSTKNIKLIYYEFELNDRGTLGTEASIYSYDYSPTRHTLRGQYTHILDKKWRVRGDMQFRISDFPVSSTIDRDDERWKLALSADYRFDRTFKLTAKYEYSDRSSTEDQYDYNKSVVQVGMSKSF